MRQLDAQSYLSKTSMTEADLWVDFQKWVKSAWILWWRLKTVLRATTALTWTLWHMSPNILTCQSVSYTTICFLSSCEPTDAVVSIVCVQVTLLPESSRRLTSFSQVDYTLLMGSVSQICDNFLSRPQSQPILKPFQRYILIDGSLNLNEMDLHVGFHVRQNTTKVYCKNYCHLKYAGVLKGGK